MQSDKVLNLPAGYFGIVLGTIGMGFAWRYASQVWQVSHWLGDGLVILAMIIDFYFGISKAKQIGEARGSEGYKRSIAKFNLYFGMLVFAFIFDALVPITYFFEFLLIF